MKVLQRERQARGLSQAALARKSGVCEANYSRIERGRSIPYPPELQRIAAALDWPAARAEELLEEVESE
jgi:transcriptional regulator with XRE-family HTH domain